MTAAGELDEVEDDGEEVVEEEEEVAEEEVAVEALVGAAPVEDPLVDAPDDEVVAVEITTPAARKIATAVATTHLRIVWVRRRRARSRSAAKLCGSG